MEQRPEKASAFLWTWEGESNMADLMTNYLGLELKNPLVASASPLSEKVDTVIEMEAKGVSAVVMYSLFEEQIIKESLALDHYLEYGTEFYAEALSYIPDHGRYSIGPEKYLNHIKALKDAVSIPVIASLNGVTTGKWIEYSQKIEEAGADALELNLYNVPTDESLSAAELEEGYINLVQNVSSGISIPLAVKLSPFFTSLPNFVGKITKAGAKGLVLFNRFYQPDFDLEKLEISPSLKLSTSDELLLPLRWIAILFGKVEIDFALTGGVHNEIDVLKAAMSGAKVSMIASEFLANGLDRAAEILEDLEDWMIENEYESIQQMTGSLSQARVGDSSALERANYMKVLSNFKF
jgi:dihydroorotate dehydrogenase (fumarate)